MSIQAKTYFSNSVVGTPQIGAGIDIHRVDTTPKFAVGFGFQRADGAIFRYCEMGASDTNRGVLVCPADSENGRGSTVVDIDNMVWNHTAATKVEGDDFFPGEKGSHFVQATLASITANQLKGGYFVPTDGTGTGYTYRVYGNTATNDPVTGAVRIQLYEPLVETLDTTTDIAIVSCRFANLVLNNKNSGSANNCAVGVTCAGMSATNYGWIQTRGICGVLAGAVVPVQGQLVIAGSGVAGSVIGYTSASSSAVVMDSYTNIVGYCVDPGDSAGHMVVNLLLE